MTAGLVHVVPVSTDRLTDDQIRAFRDSLPVRYHHERDACEVALAPHDDRNAWRYAARRWVAYRINRVAGLNQS